MSELPLLPSQHKEYKEKIRDLKNQLTTVHASALRKVTAIINNSNLISVEIKEALLKEVWK